MRASERDLAFSRVSLGFQHGLALSSDGGVWAWGRAERGQLAMTDEELGFAVGAPAEEASRSYTGAAADPRTGKPVVVDRTPNDQYVAALARIPFFDNRASSGRAPVVDVCCGFNHSLALLGDGTVLAWGKWMGEWPGPGSARSGRGGGAANGEGDDIGDSAEEEEEEEKEADVDLCDQFLPVPVRLPRDEATGKERKAVRIACGQFHSVVVAGDGSAFVFGIRPVLHAYAKEAGDGKGLSLFATKAEGRRSRIVPPSRPERVFSSASSALFGGEELAALHGGIGKSVAVTKSGRVFKWEWTDEPEEDKEGEAAVAAAGGGKVVDVSLGFRHTAYHVDF